MIREIIGTIASISVVEGRPGERHVRVTFDTVRADSSTDLTFVVHKTKLENATVGDRVRVGVETSV